MSSAVVLVLLLITVPLQLWCSPSGEAARAVIEKRCLNCHGQAQTSGLDLRRIETMKKGGKRGAAIVPGNSSESLLYKAVARTGDVQMPPGQPLPKEEVEAIRVWIDEGANWDSSSMRGSTWWAFQKVVRPQVPSVEQPEWVTNPLDAFILQALAQKGMKPVAPAGKRSLIRRAYLDLWGMPPEPGDVTAFVNDSSSGAYAKLIDRLLASPRYGERWGRHWLDVARYADTGGFETDMYYANAWRYRDYVIKSFNDDKPYNRFVQEQIAGDELWPDNLELTGGYDIPAEKLKHLDAHIGTALYTIGPTYHEAALNGEQLRYEWMTDAVDITGQAFLGLTVNCARCHDHKFDPISQRDYHRMMALFAGSQEREIPVVSMMNVFGFKSGYPNLLLVDEYKESIKKIEEKVRQRTMNGIKARFPREVMEAYETPAQSRTPEQAKLAAQVEAALTEAGLRENAAGKDFVPQYTPQEKDERDRLLYELGKAALKANYGYATATVLGHSDTLPDVHMTSRGDFHGTGPKVGPGFPAVLGGANDLNEPSAGPFVPQRRRALALWLTGPEHPLTARVMVNRLWAWHFGRGIVGTPGDFGRQGEPPAHPELLDWLASEFVQQGWSIKQMHRLIMLSSAYQMSSQFDERNAKIDPENRYLWRMNRQRMDAEQLRDSILEVSGALNLKMGGRPVIPPLTNEEKRGMWALNQWPAALDPAEHNRRSVYLYVKRSFPFPMLTIFDEPEASASCPRRDSTTVAPQALAMMNSEFMVQNATRFAERVQKEHPGDPAAWIGSAWQWGLNRAPSQAEAGQALAFLNGGALRASGVAAKPAGTSGAMAVATASAGAMAELCLVLMNTNEFLYID